MIAPEDIDFDFGFAHSDHMAALFDEAAGAQLHQRARVLQWDFILEFRTRDSGFGALDREKGFRFTHGTHAKRYGVRQREISLPDRLSLIRPPAPAFSCDEKLAFSFVGHG